MKKCVVSINVPPPQLWGGQHTEMFVDHVTVFSQSVSHIRLSHTIYGDDGDDVIMKKMM